MTEEEATVNSRGAAIAAAPFALGAGAYDGYDGVQNLRGK